MSYAPQPLLELLGYLVRTTGQPSGNFGVVGNAAHVKGYHLGKDRIFTIPPGLGAADYSIQNARDDNPTNGASALDIKLPAADLRALSVWLVAQARGGNPLAADLREIIYSPDGVMVLRWDAQRGGLPQPGEADNTHLWHTHLSYYRDSEARDKTALFRAYYEDDMSYEYKAERWLLDGGPGHVTTLGAPLKADGVTPDYTHRLALLSGLAGTKKRLTEIARARLTEPSAMLSDPFFVALATYTLADTDCAAAIADDRAKARIVWG